MRPDCAPFSLFDGDLLNRGFARLGLHSRHALDLARRALLVICLTWVPMAVLALVQGLYGGGVDARNFFADYAAYAQFLVALPLFIAAERVVSRSTRQAADRFLDTGVVGPDDVPSVDASHREVERLRLWRLPEVVCIVLAYLLAFATIAPEFAGSRLQTWHTGAGEEHIFTLWGGLTLSGFWLMFVALPVLNYWWLRFAWKIAIWTRYLYRMSRLHLVLVASHPDRTGGIGFISDVQAKFALVIFAYGISNVAAVITYKVAIEHASVLLPPVWGPVVGFIVGAPALFTVPLFMFTKQLFRTKWRTLALFRQQAQRYAVEYESRWLSGATANTDRAELTEVVSLNSMASLFERLESMRVVPFDLRSGAEILASTLGSVATALPLIRIGVPLNTWLGIVSTVLKR